MRLVRAVKTLGIFTFGVAHILTRQPSCDVNDRGVSRVLRLCCDIGSLTHFFAFLVNGHCALLFGGDFWDLDGLSIQVEMAKLCPLLAWGDI